MSIYTDIIRTAGKRHPYGSNKILKYTAISPYFRPTPPETAGKVIAPLNPSSMSTGWGCLWGSSSSGVDMKLILDASKRRAALIPAVNAANGDWGTVYKYDPNTNYFSKNSASRPAHILPPGTPVDCFGL